MSYLGTVDNAGVPVTVDWMDFTRSYDAQNRVSVETTPAAFPAVQNDTVYTYEYDSNNRLSNVNQIDNTLCVNRAYAFDAAGNRLKKDTTFNATIGLKCGAESPMDPAVQQLLAYNDYSQLTTNGYVYDVFGRATTVPSADTANLAGNITFTYSPEDRILSQRQGTTQTDYNYDALDRRYQDKVGTAVKTVRHYADESDNPSWVTGTGTAAAQIDIYTPALASNLGATRKVNGTTTTAYLNIGNLHGDTVTSLELPISGYVSGPNELNVYDEYGIPQAPELDNRPVGVTAHTDTTQLFVLNYGSLGQPQRETTDTGIQFMGARGYNPITGQFLTPDPIPGGNETPYTYPNNPVCSSDYTGLADANLGARLFWYSVAADAATIAACIMFPAACLVFSIGIGIASGAYQGYLKSKDQGHTGQDQINDILGEATVGGITSGLGAKFAAPFVAGIATSFRNAGKHAIAGFIAKHPKKSDYFGGKVIEQSASYVLAQDKSYLNWQVGSKKKVK